MKKNVQLWMDALGFKNNTLTVNGSTIKIDINNNKIKYPDLIKIGRETTDNLSQKENFVVLECVIRLLKQGYDPSSIYLEKPYKLGHNTKSGNADITVENNNGVPFLIIETKTFGKEFNKEWQNTLNDGGQLFSYDKQENKASALILYESKVDDSAKLVSNYRAIVLKDNDDFLHSLDNVKGYKDAIGGDDRFNTWKQVYQCDYTTNGVLEQSIQPFSLGKPKKTVYDLKDITHNEVKPKYNEFTSILRKYNISGHENAFDKLVNLFLAKIVDEQQNPKDLQFNWKGVSQDSYFDLVDRLQKLYTVGMERFLNERVTYVSEKNIVDSFRLRKDAAKDAILKYFKELKYYSDNDFTFLEVYNEQLFYQNSKVLVEIVQMLQDMKLRTHQQNQFLGDLFEGYLDNGVKQSEGQFFTPLPIVKFIVSSLPLKNIINDSAIPKVIDYACGSGHFLNEYADEIKSFVPKEELQDYYSQIYGIEKEYRLSKVSKVSAFMYGQDNIHIIYGDALDRHNEIKDNSFSIIISNPPYSVKGFLETLPQEERDKYQLMKYVDNVETSNSIELFFLERAKQLLRNEGVAAIIVPSSVLSNGNLYEKARKLLLQDFNIIAIVELGSKTFGSTGTNTATLFLQKKKYPPKESDNYKYSVERWFNNSDDLLPNDINLIQSYCSYLGYDYDLYCELQGSNLQNIFNIELFADYKKDFSSTSTAKRILKRKITKRFTSKMKQKEYERKETAYIVEREKEKVTYFGITKHQTTPVVIVKSPNTSSDMQKFLGYKWSKRKGAEGIKYLGANISNDDLGVSKNRAISSIQTPLFNGSNLSDSTKINVVIRNNFNGTLKTIPENLQKYVSTMSLVDMLDFKQASFDAEIKTSKENKITLQTKYPVKRLGEVVDIKIGGTPSRSNNSFYQDGKNLWVSVSELNGQVIKDTKEKITDEAVHSSNVKLLPKGTTLLSFKLTIGKTAIAGKNLYTNEAIAGLIPRNKKQLLNKYIFLYFDSRIINLGKTSGNNAFGKSLNSKFLKNEVPIPIPPINVQKKIISEAEVINNKYLKSQRNVEKYRKEIKNIFESLDIMGGGVTYRLSNDLFNFSIGKRVLNGELTNSGIPVYSANVFQPFGYIQKKLLKDFSSPSIIWGIDGDWMVNLIPKNKPFYPTDHIGVLRMRDETKINYRYLAYKLYNAGLQQNFSRSNRASMGRIKQLSITVPDVATQNKAMEKVSKFEQEIVEEQKLMTDLQQEKKKVLDKYLQ